MVERREVRKEVPRKIAIYGKAGVGKSITSAHISAALSHMGERVMQVGCDPKRDSIALLCHGIMPTVLEKLSLVESESERGKVDVTEEVLNEVLFSGYNDIVCCESGGPRPGIGCAGRGVLVAIQLLEEFDVYRKRDISFAIFDVLGDVVCGGFAQPMRGGQAREIYIVTCGEPLTLYITNEIIRAVNRIAGEGIEVGVAGLINNQRNVAFEREIVEEYARQVGVPVVEHVPRSLKVQEAEMIGQTVIEAFPDSDQAHVYRSLARKVLDNRYIYVPKPLSGMDDILNIVDSFLKEEKVPRYEVPAPEVAAVPEVTPAPEVEKGDLPWQKLDRSLESWEIARNYLGMRAEKKFEIVSFKDIVEKTPDTTASEWWEKTVPGYGSGVWCPVYYAIGIAGGVPNSVILFHGPQHCITACRHFWIPYGGGGGGNLYWGNPFAFIPATDMSERDAILGAPDKLKKAILEVDEVYRPELITVVPACTPGMIGEPIQEVIEDVKPLVKSEVRYLDTPGFKCIDEGDMIRLCMGNYWINLMEEPKQKDKGSVNMVGEYRSSVWQEKHGMRCNFPTTYDELNRILKAMGLRLKTVLPQAPLAELKKAPEAEFNVVICPQWGYILCEEMEERFKIPFSKHIYPLGIESITNYVMAIAEYFGKEKEARALLDKEFAKIRPLWEEAKKLLKGKVALLDSAISMASVNRQLGYGRMLKELGVEKIIFFNISPSEILGRREGVEYFVSQTVLGEPYNPMFIWWPTPHAIKLSPIEVMDFMGLKPNDVIYMYGDLAWYAKAPFIDASNTAQVQSGIHWRRHRNVCSRSIFFTGTIGLLKDIIDALKTSQRKGKWTFYSRIMGNWEVPKKD